mmetsp:Transcript_4806/g.15760  ORF Transcript_4806/g.15760 Transcript_4806/m.15760 type:complete len:331 (-) Transcript_4806:42-1034(-)
MRYPRPSSFQASSLRRASGRGVAPKTSPPPDASRRLPTTRRPRTTRLPTMDSRLLPFLLSSSPPGDFSRRRGLLFPLVALARSDDRAATGPTKARQRQGFSRGAPDGVVVGVGVVRKSRRRRAVRRDAGGEAEATVADGNVPRLGDRRSRSSPAQEARETMGATTRRSRPRPGVPALDAPRCDPGRRPRGRAPPAARLEAPGAPLPPVAQAGPPSQRCRPGRRGAPAARRPDPNPRHLARLHSGAPAAPDARLRDLPRPRPARHGRVSPRSHGGDPPTAPASSLGSSPRDTIIVATSHFDARSPTCHRQYAKNRLLPTTANALLPNNEGR